MTQTQIGAAAREYKPLLDDLKAACTQQLGELIWLPRQDTEVTQRGRDDPTPVIRVGPDFARGVLLSAVDPVRLTAALNVVLAKHDFPQQPTLTGSPSGHLTFQCRDGAMSELNFWLKGDVEFWVDVSPGH